jgi:hypothetical protein
MPPKKKTGSRRPASKAASKPAAKQAPKRKGGGGQQLKLVLATLFLLFFLLLCLVLLSELRRAYRPAPPPASLATARPAPHPEAPPAPPPTASEEKRPEAPSRRPSPAPPILTGGGGRVAIIMDDLGRDLATARELLAIDLPVTFSILPDGAHASQVAALAHHGGREVMLHIPMEPQGYPAADPGADALFVDQPAAEIRERFQGYLEQVPFAAGGNNHMGSRFTESREGMAAVLGAMKEAELFFVDSRTSGKSVALDEARRAGVPATGRDLFLDNIQEVEQITREIYRLAEQAARHGEAVGICHPYPQTLAALRRAAPWLRQSGVELVPVSQLVD